MKLTFNQKFVFVFLVILIFLLILVLENKESFSLGGGKSRREKFKTAKAAKKLAKKEIQRMQERGLNKERMQKIKRKFKKTFDINLTDTELIAEEAEKTANDRARALVQQLAGMEREEKKTNKGILGETNTTRVLTAQALKNLQITDKNLIKRMKKLQKREKTSLENVNFKQELKFDNYVNERSTFQKRKDQVTQLGGAVLGGVIAGPAGAIGGYGAATPRVAKREYNKDRDKRKKEFLAQLKLKERSNPNMEALAALNSLTELNNV